LQEINRELDEKQKLVQSKNPQILLGILVKQLQRFREKFEQLIGITTGTHYNTHEVSEGHKMNLILNQKYQNEIENMTYNEEQLGKNICVALLTIPGIQQTVFTSNAAFIAVVRKQIEKFLMPSHVCVDVMKEHVNDVIQKCLADIHDYPTLQKTMSQVLEEWVERCASDTRDKLSLFTSVQVSYFNFSHKDFKDVFAKIDKESGIVSKQYDTADFETINGDLDSERDVYERMDVKQVDVDKIPPHLEKAVECIKLMFKEYIDGIIKTTYRDFVPKLIYYTLIEQVNDYIASDLLANIQFTEGKSNLEELMARSKALEMRLQKLVADKQVYDDAAQVLSDIRMKSGV
jgi:hypothetical protein